VSAERYIVVIDAGTTLVWCHLFDSSGKIVASRSMPWAYQNVEEISPYAREFDHQAVWDRLCGLVGQVVDNASNRNNVAAISVTSQRQGVVFLDRQGGELYAGPNLDLRSVFEGAAIDDEYGERVYDITGHTPSFLFAAAKLKWYQSNRPSLYNSITTVLPLSDWLNWKLTGEMASERTVAGEAGLLDIRQREWCTELYGDLGLASNDHVPLVDSATVLGTVQASAAMPTGLPVSTLVVSAGADTQCGLLGLGPVRPAQVGVVAGWSAPVQMVTDTPVFSQEAKTWAGCHVTPLHWVAESNASDTGNVYRWVAKTFWPDQPDPFAAMGQAAEAVAAGADGALAFLGPSRMDMNNVGLRAGGLLFPVPMTMNEPSRAQITRAALEAIAYAVKSNVDQVEAVVGRQAERVAVGGGMTRTKLWTDVLVNVLDRPVQVSPEPHVSAVGAYLCGATGICEFSSLEEAATSVASTLETFDPNPTLAMEYHDHYEHWLEIEASLKEIQL
jgi:autoinducer 2 (AI-2) kinase